MSQTSSPLATHQQHLEIVLPFRQGDPTPLGLIFPTIRQNFSLRYTGLGIDRNTGDELFQHAVEAMLINFSNEHFVLTCPVEAYLTVIFRNKVLEYFRQSGRQPVRMDLLADIPVAPLEQEQLVAEEERAVRWHLLLRRTLAQLEERCRRIFDLTGEKIPATTIAETLEMTNANAVYQARLRCREAWARHIEADADFADCKPGRW